MVNRILRNRMLNATKVGARKPLNSKAQAGFETMTAGATPHGVMSPKPAQVLQLVQRVPLPADAILGFPVSPSSSDRDCQSHERTHRTEKQPAKHYWPQSSTRNGSAGK
jgi:hypothetical protein